MGSVRSVEVVQEEIERCFEELAALSPTSLTDGEVTDFSRRAQRIRSMADAQCVRAAGALDVSKVWTVDGARSATAWIAWQCRTSRARASSAVVCARVLRDMPLCEEALLAGRLTTDHVVGEVFARELERLEQGLFEADLAEARARLGQAATLGDLGRSPRQRRADALRVMAERSAAKPPDATEPRVLLHVLAGAKSLERMCELSNGQVLTPGQVLPTLEHADVERVIFDGPSKVIDIGVRQRLFRSPTRTAVEVRDRQCTHPSCDVPAERCEIDHVIPFEHGGPTTQANGHCLCKYHHRRSRPPP